MAAAHITQKELVQAADYFSRARVLQLEMGKVEQARLEK